MDETHLWSEINSHTSRPNAQNTSLTRIFEYFNRHMHELNALNVGNILTVERVNRRLADYIQEINRTQKGAERWLTENKYELAQQHCEDIIQRIPHEISQIFDITKNRDFLNYIRDSSDFCYTSGRIVSPGVEDLGLYNVVMDFYTTIAVALIKGYITSQMAYMVLAVKTTR